MQITDEMIQAGRSDKGGWTREQLRLLGVPAYKSSPPKGWKRRIIGHDISPSDAARFLALGPQYQEPLLPTQPAAQPKPKSHIAQLVAEGKSLAEIHSQLENQTASCTRCNLLLPRINLLVMDEHTRLCDPCLGIE